MSDLLFYSYKNDFYHLPAPLLLCPTVAAGDQSGTETAMAPISRENPALVRRFLMHVVACGDTNTVADLLAADPEDHPLVFEGAQRRGTVTELGWQVLASADVNGYVEDVGASADRVAVRGQENGTHQESLMELTPTGWSFEIENGQIAGIWSLPDGLGLLTQLDVVLEEYSTQPLPSTSQG